MNEYTRVKNLSGASIVTRPFVGGKVSKDTKKDTVVGFVLG